jgi:4-amino-4-deoxy-L-arabinose transferase-like glycosyltransferase
MALTTEGALLLVALTFAALGVYQSWRERLSPQTAGLAVMLLHMGLAISYRYLLGLRLTPDLMTGGFIQFASWESLQHDTLTTLWYFHAQPPLFNLYAAWLSLLAPSDPSWAMHLGNILMGGLICLLSYRITHPLTNSPTAALLTGLLFALSPALLLYETYVLYDVAVLFLILLAGWCLVIYQQRGQWPYLIAFMLVINALILTRSLYQWVLLAPMIALAVLLARSQWRKVLIYSLLVSLMSLGWYTKNLVLFDFWGTSSWYGLNLWRAVVNQYSAEELEALQKAGLVSDFMMDGRHSFSDPSTYTAYPHLVTYSSNPMLNRQDFNNESVIAVSQDYFAASLRVIRYDPKHYWANIRLTYRGFSCPAANFAHLDANFQRMAGHAAWGNNLLQGRGLWRWLGLHHAYCTWDYFLLPLTLLTTWVSPWWRGETLAGVIRRYAVPFYLSGMLFYTALASVMLEYGENNRFSFAPEYLTWLLLAPLLYRLIKGLSARMDTTHATL